MGRRTARRETFGESKRQIEAFSARAQKDEFASGLRLRVRRSEEHPRLIQVMSQPALMLRLVTVVMEARMCRRERRQKTGGKNHEREQQQEAVSREAQAGLAKTDIHGQRAGR